MSTRRRKSLRSRSRRGSFLYSLLDARSFEHDPGVPRRIETEWLVTALRHASALAFVTQSVRVRFIPPVEMFGFLLTYTEFQASSLRDRCDVDPGNRSTSEMGKFRVVLGKGRVNIEEYVNFLLLWFIIHQMTV